MKAFLSRVIDFQNCQFQLEEFEKLLNYKEELSEKHDLAPFFKQRQDLVSLIGHLHPSINKSDKYAHEFDIFGDFSSDFALGDSRRGAFCFVELEDARRNSIFKDVGRATTDWSPRFEHGYSQIIDWSYKLDEMEKLDFFEDRFGFRSIDSFSMLVIGRSKFLSEQEKRRMKWRERHVVVRSQQVRCFTYDELLAELKELVGMAPLAYAAEDITIDLDTL
jgi:hypothetical protein